MGCLIRIEYKGKKGSRYEYVAITDEFLNNIVNQKTDGKALELPNELSQYKSVVDAFMPLHFLDTANPLGQALGKLGGKDLREQSITLSHISSMIKSEIDSQDKYQLSPDQVNQVIDNDLDTPNLNYSELSYLIGRDILKSRGQMLQYDSSTFTEAVAEYRKVGDAALKVLEDKGLVNIGVGSLINRKFIKDEAVKHEVAHKQKILTGKSILTFNESKFYGLTPEAELTNLPSHEVDSVLNSNYTKRKNIDTTISAVRKLVLPTGISVPKTSPIKLDTDMDSIKLTDDINDIRQKINDIPLRVSEEAQGALNFILEEIGMHKNMKTKDVLHSLSTYIEKNPTVSKYLFGTVDAKSILEDYNSDLKGIEKTFGQSNSKVMDFIRVLDYIGKDDFDLNFLYYSSTIANQNRAHLNQDVMNYQANKHFVRPSMEANEAITLDTNEANYMIAYIMDETGYTADEILGRVKNKKTANIEHIINILNSDQKGDAVYNIAFVMSQQGSAAYFPKAESAWQVLKYIKGIKDLREGYDNNSVKTRFLAEPDGTASGALITMLQSAGSSKEAAEFVQKMGTKEGYKDTYDVVVKGVFEKQLGDYEKTKSTNNIMNKRRAAPAIAAKEIANLNLTGIYSIRDLIKLPFTKNTYGQLDTNNRLEVAKEITQDILANENIDAAMYFLNQGNGKYEIGDIVNYMNQDKGALRKLLVQSMNREGSNIDLIVKTISGKLDGIFEDQQKYLQDMFSLIEEARNSGIINFVGVLPPAARLHLEEKFGSDFDYAKARKYLSNIEKSMEVVVDTGNPKDLITTRRKFPNVNSLKVLLQHMVDAAVYFRSTGKTLEEIPNYKNGFMGIHDAKGADIKFSMVDEANYKAELQTVNMNYDFVGNVLDELQYIANQARNTNLALATKINTYINGHSDVISKRIEAKQAILQQANFEDTYGVKTAILKEVNKSVKPDPQNKNSVSTGSTKITTSSETAINDKTQSTIPTYTPEQYKEALYKGISQIQDKPTRKLFEQALKMNPNLHVEFNSENKYYYDAKTNTVHLSNQAGTNKVHAVLHELVHAATAQKIETDPKYRTKVQKLYTAALKNKNLTDYMNTFEQLPENQRLHEFMAEGISNSAFAKDLSKVSYGRKVLNAIRKLVLVALGLDTAKYNTIYGRLLDTFIDAGVTDKVDPKFDMKFDFIDVTKRDHKGFDPTKEVKLEGKLNKLSDVYSETYIKLDNTVSNMLESTLDYSVDRINALTPGKDNLHTYMMKHSKVYHRSANAVSRTWKDNVLINKVKFYLNASDTVGKDEFKDMLTQVHNTFDKKEKADATYIKELSPKYEAAFSESERAPVYQLLTETGLVHLVQDKELHQLLDGTKSIDQLIHDTKLKSGFNKTQITSSEAHAVALSEYYVNKIVPTHGRNTLNLSPKTKTLTDKLAALYAIKLVDPAGTLLKDIGSNKAKAEVFQELMDYNTGINAITNELLYSDLIDSDQHNGNLNNQVFSDNIQTKVVTKDSITTMLDADRGWKVLRKPTKGKVGIIYRIANDATYTTGLGTNMKFSSNLDLHVKGISKNKLAINNAIPTAIEGLSKLVLTNQELETLGLVKDPVKSLIYSYSHKESVLETQSVREMISDKFTYQYTEKIAKQIKKDILNDKHLWYIRLDDDTSIDDLPNYISRKYKVVNSKSDIGDFNKGKLLVRKDLEDFIHGGRSLQIGETGTTLNKAYNLLRKSIIIQKIHWVITNPAKTALDLVSNTSLLLSVSVPIKHIYQDSKEAMNNIQSLIDLRQELLKAELNFRAGKTNGTDIPRLEDEIKNHPMAASLYNGFFQSINTDIQKDVTNDGSGIHKDINTFLNKILKDNKGDATKIGKTLEKFMTLGFNGEDVLVGLANKLNSKTSSNASKSVADTLEEIADHIKTIKHKKDVASYLQEYMMTPETAGVTVGSLITQMTDFVPRWVLYKHFKRQGSDEREAANKALDYFLDYRVNMPKELRLLEHIGVTKFISFWGRIQRIILLTLKNNPVNAGVTIILNEYLGIGSADIFGADVLSRLGEGHVVGAPQFGIDMLLPTKLI